MSDVDELEVEEDEGIDEALLPGPPDVLEHLIEDIKALPWRYGEVFDAIDVTHRLDAGWNPRAIEVTLKEMARRHIIRVTTYWEGNLGFGPVHPKGKVG
jgi:hypothetical protein